MKKIHIVPHSHWDREWYFTLQDTLVLSDFVITDVLEELEKNPEATFCLDGQSSVVKDYLKLYPEKKGLINKLAVEGRLTFGPWYTQTDCLYVNGESIIRNLYYGSYLATNFGGNMNVAYLPDTFGFNAQMPTIIKNCGFDNFIFRRGADYSKIPDSLFKWQGLGNKSVNTVHLMEGYGVAHNLSSDQSYLNTRLKPYIEKVSKLTEANQLLICSGGDQSTIIPNLNQELTMLSENSHDDYTMSTFPKYFEEMSDYFQKIYTGEFRDPVYDRVHRTIGGIRYDIKQQNYLVEQKLIKRVEPLIAIGSKFGLKVSSHLLYEAWELLLEGHAHDAMGGCVTDNVAKQILDRFNRADEIADGLENYIKYKISEKLNLNENQLIIFNTDIKTFSGTKNISFMSKNPNATILNHEFIKTSQVDYAGKKDLLIEAVEGHIFVNEDPYHQLKGSLQCSIPALGFKVFEIDHEHNVEVALKAIESTQIETLSYSIDFSDGIKITNKKSNTTIENLISFEDVGNDGDTYDFSPLKDDKPILFKPQLTSIKACSDRYEVEMLANCNLPTDLNNRLTNSNSKQLTIKLNLTVSNNDNINCKLEIDNTVRSHRLRAVIKTIGGSKESISGVPFGYLKRPIFDNTLDTHDNFVETPIDIHPSDDFCALSNQQTIYVSTAGIKEYQARHNKLFLTLLSTTSQLGKPNLEYRPGRASGDTTKKGHVMIETPSAEQLGINQFEFSIAFDHNQFSEEKATELNEDQKQQSIYYQKQTLNKFINRLDNKIMPEHNIEFISKNQYSLFEIDTKCQLISISPSITDKDYYLLRLANPTANTQLLKLPNELNYQIVDACENMVDSCLDVGPYDFITLKIKLPS